MLKRTAFFLILAALATAAGHAQVPHLINYQGFLTDGIGNPINGTLSIEYRIYDVATDGTSIWNETQSVSVADGLFSVLLGSVTPIPYSIFGGGQKYLGVKVESDAEMTPRTQLVNVAYAFLANKADSLGSHIASDFITTVDGVPPNGSGDIDLVAGTNVTITPDAGAHTVTIAAPGGGGGDNLGDHTATENVQLNGYWLSGDGEDEGVYVDNSGNVGIGTTSPIWELVVANLTPGDGAESAVTADDATGAIAAYSSTLPVPFTHFAGRASLFSDAATFGLDVRADGVNGDIRLYTGGFASINERMRITEAGYVGIGTGSPNYRLDVRGTIGNNTTLYHSDIRWKKNVKSLDRALETALALRGVRFEWRRDEFPEMEFSSGEKVGLIAQEVEAVIPELVATDRDGYKSVEYSNLVALLIEATKDQQKEIESLKSQTAELTASLHRMEQLLVAEDDAGMLEADDKNPMPTHGQ